MKACKQLHYGLARESIENAYIFHHHLLCFPNGHAGSQGFALKTKIATESIQIPANAQRAVAYSIMGGKRYATRPNRKQTPLTTKLLPQCFQYFRNMDRF
jgi:hypothetical protein